MSSSQAVPLILALTGVVGIALFAASFVAIVLLARARKRDALWPGLGCGALGSLSLALGGAALLYAIVGARPGAEPLAAAGLLASGGGFCCSMIFGLALVIPVTLMLARGWVWEA